MGSGFGSKKDRFLTTGFLNFVVNENFIIWKHFLKLKCSQTWFIQLDWTKLLHEIFLPELGRHWDFTILFRILDHYDMKLWCRWIFLKSLTGTSLEISDKAKKFRASDIASKNINHQYNPNFQIKFKVLNSQFYPGNHQNIWNSISTIPILGYKQFTILKYQHFVVFIVLSCAS